MTAPAEGTLAAFQDGLLVDLDGVVYVGPDAVPGAVESLTAAHDAGLRWAFVTNNASRPAVQVAEQLRGLGIDAGPEAVVTSAQIAATLVRRRLGDGARVLAVGGPGVAVALREAGLEAVDSADAEPVAVVQGFGRDVSWRHLAEATVAVRAGALWVATNTDLVIPTERGAAPGNGTLVAAVRTATGVDPVVAGKPEAVAFAEPARRLGLERPLVVGDRLDTDIAGGVAAGFDTLLVLTGVHGPPQLLAAPADLRPVHVALDLTCLQRPVPRVDVLDPGRRARSGDVVVELVDGELRTTGSAASADPVDALRAALALAWPARDNGARADASADLMELWADLPR